MHSSLNTGLRSFLVATAIGISLGMTQAKSVSGDAAIPVVELMPLTMKHEVDLKLTDQQIQALADYRKQAMPSRVALQKKIIDLRGQLRMAMLNGQPATDRAALMQQIAAAEVEHFQARERCVENMRNLLSQEQYKQLAQLYLNGLR